MTDKTFDDRISEQWYQPRIPRAVLKELMKRSDAQGLRNFGLWLVLLIASGVVAALTWGTWWAVPAFFVYGTIYSSSDARWHELAHGTPFKTRWLNDAFYHLSSFMTIREAYWWRWSHARHHTHTYFVERDPEIQVARPTQVCRSCSISSALIGGVARNSQDHSPCVWPRRCRDRSVPARQRKAEDDLVVAHLSAVIVGDDRACRSRCAVSCR